MSDKALQIELWPVSDLIPYDKNAKKHSQDQVEKLARLIRENGWTQPIVVDKDGVIIAGHGRRLASLHLGLDKVPVVCRRDLTKAEADALRLADNRVSSTDYDTALLQEELARLGALEFDLTGLGFDDKELEFMTADLGAFNEDVFVEDIGEAVETQREENQAEEVSVDQTAAPVGDALGFKRVTIEQSRTLRAFMARIEAETGCQGAEALIAHAQSHAAVHSQE